MKILRHSLVLFMLFGAIGFPASLQAAELGISAATEKTEPEHKDLVLKGDAVCTACHDEADAPELLYIGKTRHGTAADSRTPTCTQCHGESKQHVLTPNAPGFGRNPTAFIPADIARQRSLG